jgi:thiamine biosynthesis lipoprotein
LTNGEFRFLMDSHMPGEIEATLGIEGRQALAGVRRYSREAMATVFEVYAAHPDDRYAAQAARAAFDLTDRLEQELSRFAANSDVARINGLAAGERTRVSSTTFECLAIARHMLDVTGGAFDVSLGTGLASLELDPGDVTVRSTGGGVRIDLGGIGKGYAVDVMTDLLEEWGLASVLVHGGFSSVLATEPPAERDGWPLTLSDPTPGSRVLARLSARQTALSASGVRKVDHIVDPRTGLPARECLAAWVALRRPERTGVAVPSEAAVPPQEVPRLAAAAVAEGLSTAFMLLGLEEIQALCERSPGLEAWILPGTGSPGSTNTLLHFGSPVG